jgi:hypothetical protein
VEQHPQPPRPGLPAYDTLLYLEKLGVVIFTALGIVYLALRSMHAGPAVAVKEIGGLKHG